MTPDALPYALAALLLSGLFLLAYRRDLADARLFAAIRRAAKHPYAERKYHEAFARRHGLHWGPCPRCGKDFGGHEMTGKTIPHTDPKRSARGERLPVCPPCSLDLRAPAPSSLLKDPIRVHPRRAGKR